MAIEYRTEPEYWEYLDGKVYPKVSPRRTHALVQTSAIVILKRLAAGRGLVGSEFDFYLGGVDGTDTKFIPDVAFLSSERYSKLAKKDRDYPPIAPDVAIEIRSPSNRTRYIAKKIARYLACGTLLVLDVDPAKRTVTAHANDGVREYRSDERFAHPAVPWLVFNVAEMFEDLESAERLTRG